MRPERRFVSRPRINAIPRTDYCEIDALREPKPREQRVPEAFVIVPLAAIECNRRAVSDPRAVFFGRGDVLPPRGATCRVRAAPKAEPFAVLPVFQVVAVGTKYWKRKRLLVGRDVAVALEMIHDLLADH